MKHSPHLYQKKAVDFLLDRKFAALFLDPGLGKTSIVLSALKALGKPRTLIIAPLRVCSSVWPGEVQKWDEFQDFRISFLHGDRLAASKVDADIYLMNPEGVPWLEDNKKFLKGIEVLVVDELTRFKNTTARRFRILKHLLNDFKYRWGLTGSPVANGLIDLFGQMYVIDQGESLGTSITKYRGDYFDQYQFKLTPRPESLNIIMGKVANRVLTMNAEDYLDMPELVFNDIFVDLPENVKELYRDMEDNLICTLNDEVFVATNTVAAMNKCMQIANGGIYNEQQMRTLHTEKIEALNDLQEELQKPLLVAYNFLHDIIRYDEYNKVKAPFIGGSVSVNAANHLINMWNENKLPILFGHPASIAHGVNLQGGSNHLCWYSLTWNMEHYDQFIRRIYRQGVKHQHVVVHRIIARGTIDEVIVKVLEKKITSQLEVFNILKSYYGGVK